MILLKGSNKLRKKSENELLKTGKYYLEIENYWEDNPAHPSWTVARTYAETTAQLAALSACQPV